MATRSVHVLAKPKGRVQIIHNTPTGAVKIRFRDEDSPSALRMYNVLFDKVLVHHEGTLSPTLRGVGYWYDERLPNPSDGKVK